MRELYTVAGLGWAARIGTLPVLSNLVDATYALLSKYRWTGPQFGKGLQRSAGGSFDGLLDKIL